MSKVLTLNKSIHSYKNIFSSILLFCSLISSYLLFMSTQINIIPTAQAHLEHLPHYNSGGNRYGYGNYISFVALQPEYGTTDHPTQITFSIQDFDNNDVYNVSTMVEIYESISGKRIHVFPWTFRDVGDFSLYYQFPRKGSYQIVLSIANSNNNGSLRELASYLPPSSPSSSSIDPPRSILGDVSDCDCTRTIFNISVASNFGDIRNGLYFISIIAPVTLLGIVLIKNYSKKRRELKEGQKGRRVRRGGGYIVSDNDLDVSNNENNNNNETSSSSSSVADSKQLIKHLIMLLALAGGIVHLVVFPGHGSLHIYYSIFLLAAAGAQITYGVLYFLIMLSKPFYEISDQQQQEVIKSTYRYNMAVNLFGFVGTAVLVGLYIYVVIYPPPLSPTNQPEEIEIAGVLSKSVEVALLIGIAFIIRWDRQAFKHISMEIRR
jgi:hypothetical protein